MNKLHDTFKFNNEGRIDLRDDNSLIKTPESSGTKYKYWIGTKNNPKSFLVKTTPEDKLCDVAEVITSKMLKKLNMPYAETALGQTLIKDLNHKESFLDKFFKNKNIQTGTFSNCIITENITTNKTISAEDIFALAEEKYKNVNPSLINQIRSHSSLQELEQAINMLNEYTLPKATLLNLQKLIIFDYATGQTDRSSQDIIFNIDKNNNLSLAPIIDNEMINFFYYKKTIFQTYANKVFDADSYTNSFIPIFTFCPSKEKKYEISQDIESYGCSNNTELFKFSKDLYNLNIPSLFKELQEETGFNIISSIPTFFNNYKNSKCIDLINSFESNFNLESEDNPINDIASNDMEVLPEI